MQIPFTAPHLPELDALPAERRALVLGQYALSPEARRFARLFQSTAVAAVAVFLVGQVLDDWLRAACFVAAPLLLVGGMALYRLSANRVILAILHSQNFDHGHPPAA